MRNACAHRVRECDFKDEGCQFMVSHIYFDALFIIILLTMAAGNR